MLGMTAKTTSIIVHAKYNAHTLSSVRLVALLLFLLLFARDVAVRHVFRPPILCGSGEHIANGASTYRKTHGHAAPAARHSTAVLIHKSDAIGAQNWPS